VGADGRITNIANTSVAGVSNFTYYQGNNTFSITTSDGGVFDATLGELEKYITVANANARLANTNAYIAQIQSELYATNTDIRTAISNAVADLVDSAPETLNTLNELAAAINDDANFTTWVVNNLNQKISGVSVSNTGVLVGANVSNFNFTGEIEASGNATHVTVNVPIQEVALATAQAGENLRLNFPKSANVVANDAYSAVALDNIGHEVSADCTNSEHVSRVVGLKVANGDVVSTGIVENSGWSWTSNSTIYIGSGTNPPGANNLTILPSVEGAFFSLPIGIALSPTRVFVKVGTSVVLGS